MLTLLAAPHTLTMLAAPHAPTLLRIPSQPLTPTLLAAPRTNDSCSYDCILPLRRVFSASPCLTELNLGSRMGAQALALARPHRCFASSSQVQFLCAVLGIWQFPDSTVP
jgi:hypothetical protein